MPSRLNIQVPLMAAILLHHTRCWSGKSAQPPEQVTHVVATDLRSVALCSPTGSSSWSARPSRSTSTQTQPDQHDAKLRRGQPGSEESNIDISEAIPRAGFDFAAISKMRGVEIVEMVIFAGGGRLRFRDFITRSA